LGDTLIAQLAGILTALQEIKYRDQPHLFAMTSTLKSAELPRQLADTCLATDEPTLIARLNPLRWIARRRVRERLEVGGHDPSDDGMVELKDALELEIAVRNLKVRVDEVRQPLRLPSDLTSHSVHTLEAAAC
jgi:hypothetical protein